MVAAQFGGIAHAISNEADTRSGVTASWSPPLQLRASKPYAFYVLPVLDTGIHPGVVLG
jgi:hypothetical protein